MTETKKRFSMTSTLLLLITLSCLVNGAQPFGLPSLSHKVVSRAETRLFECDAAKSIERTRRNIFVSSTGLVASALLPWLVLPDQSDAFENRISTNYDDRPKRKGPQVSLNVFE